VSICTINQLKGCQYIELAPTRDSLIQIGSINKHTHLINKPIHVPYRDVGSNVYFVGKRPRSLTSVSHPQVVLGRSFQITRDRRGTHTKYRCVCLSCLSPLLFPFSLFVSFVLPLFGQDKSCAKERESVEGTAQHLRTQSPFSIWYDVIHSVALRRVKAQ
jgi:hypothetical protein